jgi:hypothetical protein
VQGDEMARGPGDNQGQTAYDPVQLCQSIQTVWFHRFTLFACLAASNTTKIRQTASSEASESGESGENALDRLANQRGIALSAQIALAPCGAGEAGKCAKLGAFFVDTATAFL